MRRVLLALLCVGLVACVTNTLLVSPSSARAIAANASVVVVGVVQGGQVAGHCAGIVISPSYILTNRHCTQGNVGSVITLHNGRVLAGGLVGEYKGALDVAVVKVAETSLVPARFGDAEQMQQGDQVYAIGHPKGYRWTLTRGIVSAVGRDVWNNPSPYLQIDAVTQPGSSGGALLNERGEVIGMTSHCEKLPGGHCMGLNFALKINAALAAAWQIISLSVVQPERKIL